MSVRGTLFRRRFLALAASGPGFVLWASACSAPAARRAPTLSGLRTAFAQPYVRVTLVWPRAVSRGTARVLPTTATSIGSGWFSAAGRVVTAAHVVTPARLPLTNLPAWVLARTAGGVSVASGSEKARVVRREVGVLLANGRRLRARVEAYGQPSGTAISPLDVAVLSVQGAAGETLGLGPAFRSGERVWVLCVEGEAQAPRLVPGVVRSPGPVLATLSVLLTRGASGGAVLGRDGRVRGIVVAVSGGVGGIAWAIPAATVAGFSEQPAAADPAAAGGA